jgi:hypothetical protein
LLFVRVLSNFQGAILMAERGAIVEVRTLARTCLETVFALAAAIRMAVRLVEIFAYLDRVLSSPIFNVDIAQFAEMACGNCQETIRWRLPRDPQAVQAVCRECNATYQIEPQADGSIHWIPEETEVTCAHEDCRAGGKLFSAHIRAGQPWKCHACGQSNRIALCVEVVPKSAAGD